MTASVLEPLFPIPKLVERPWGGSSLRRWSRACEDGARIGESWEIGLMPGLDSPLEGGRFPTLSAAVSHGEGSLLGVRDGKFPLLLKLVDARETLSVQLHPVVDGPDGRIKNECWFVLEAPPEAELLAGVVDGVDPPSILPRLQAGDISSLERIPVAPGDVVVVPAGTVHAITAGLVVLEVQQPSDSTFRLHDWGRLGFDGKPRELHLEQAGRHLDARPRPGLKVAPKLVAPGREILCATPWFAMARIRPGSGAALEARNAFRLVFVLEGPVDLAWPGGSRSLEKGRTVLVPAGLRVEVSGGTVVEIWVPDRERDVLEPLLSAGFGPGDVAALSAGTLDC